MKYKAISSIDFKIEPFEFDAINDTEARHFVINHLDLSKNWELFKQKEN